MRRHIAVAAVLLCAAGQALATAPHHTAVGVSDAYQPNRVELGDGLLTPHLTLAGRLGAIDDVPLDRDGSTLGETLYGNVLARVGLSYNSMRSFGDGAFIVLAELEADLVTGFVTAGTDLAGEGLPGTGGLDTLEPRQANLTAVFGGAFALKLGLSTSHWGLGLVANDGAHGWTPGSAQFNDPRDGDRVWRAALSYKSPGEDFVAVTVAGDLVYDDDVMRDGDEAYQFVVGALGQWGGSQLGIYGVSRHQERTGGGSLDVFAVDVFGRHSIELNKGLTVVLETEWASVFGTTTFAPTPDAPESDVLQLGGVLRASLVAPKMGGVLDIFFASGDRNFDDGAQNAFKADPNFTQGLFLYRHVLAAQTGRAPVTAADPALVGQPSEDLDRFPTRGSVSNTLGIFPRFWVRPARGLEIYGGVLFALAPVSPADPLNSRIAGGTPRNALDGETSGDFGNYGTELNLGARYSMLLWGSELTIGLEGGALFVGEALQDGSELEAPVAGVRGLVRYRL